MSLLTLFATLLFVLTMQPLTKVLHKEFETSRVGDSNDNMELNHLLYTDGPKPHALDEATLSKLLQATETFFAKKSCYWL